MRGLGRLVKELLAELSVGRLADDTNGEAGVLERVWVGVDVGKQHHWVAAVDGEGRVLVSRKVANDQTAITGMLGELKAMAAGLVWTVDLTTVEAALLLAVLWEGGQQVLYLSGRAVNIAAASYRGEGKTDARDARVIADQARMRHDLPELRPGQELVVELRLLTGRRADLVADRTRTINRLRQQLTGLCPALERAACLAGQRGWLVLLARWQRPSAIRRAGVARLRTRLVHAGIRAETAERIAQAAVAAAASQTVRLPGEELTAGLVAALAEEVISLQARIDQVDQALKEQFCRHRLAPVITSMPGFGFRLGAELLAAIGDLQLVSSADQLAAYAGLAPVPNDSGKRTGRRHRPVRYNRLLRRALYLSALTASRHDPAAKAYYQRKLAEGKRPVQALTCLARRRTNVLWALLRDNRTWQPQPPVKTNDEAKAA
jgi:transposase